MTVRSQTGDGDTVGPAGPDIPVAPPDAIERTLWHPVAFADAIGAAPVAAMLFGESVLLWRTVAGGGVQAWPDRCPHRGARLSLGCIRDDHLQCPYHGWRFDAHGQCAAIPALPQFAPGANLRIGTFEAREAYGLVWVRLAPPSGAAIPLHDLPAFDAEADARLRKVTSGPYLVATSAPRIVENFLDLAHFGFVHDTYLGSPEHPAVPDYDVQRTAHGVLATGCKAWQPRSSIHAQTGAMVEYTYEVTGPYTAVLTKLPEAGTTAVAGLRESIAMFVCPVGEESSIAWTRMAMNDFESPDARLTEFQDTIFGQDRPVLESQRPRRLPLAPQAELHCAADRMSTAYRRFLRDAGIGWGVIA